FSCSYTSVFCFSFGCRPHPRSALFPYTTLFRSAVRLVVPGCNALIASQKTPARRGCAVVPEAVKVGVVRGGLVGFAGFDIRQGQDRKSTRLNSSHRTISYAVFCLKKKKKNNTSP